MIDAKDLRIGNYTLAYGKELVECTGIAKGLFYFINKEGIEDAYSLAAITPIPITPDVLAKCGFSDLWHLGHHEYTLAVTDDANMILYFILNQGESGVCMLSLSEENTDENIDLAGFVVERLLDIEYLHQLQNLYFALTGKELKVKQPIDQP